MNINISNKDNVFAYKYLIREDAKTAARGGVILRQPSSLLFDVVPEAELARGLVMPLLLTPFKSTSDLHRPAPYGSSIEQLSESPPRRPEK